MSTISQQALIATHNTTVEVIHLATGHSAQITATSLETALMHAIKLANIDMVEKHDAFTALATLTETETRTYRGLYARII